MIHLTIDGRPVEVPERTTVLQASKIAGIEIPTLCDFPALKPYGSCRLCVVEIEGMRTLQASCTTPVGEGMVVRTNTPKLHEARKFILSLIFSERNHFCMYCQKSGGDCELQNCAYGEEMTHWPIQPNWFPYPVDASNPYFALDHNRCILCRRCVRACAELVGNFTLAIQNRGYRSMLTADYDTPLGQSTCIRCGTCVQVCPTGALIDRQSAYLGLDVKAEHIKSICVGCSVGCGIVLRVQDNHLLHVDGDWEAPVNQGLLCETGRYKAIDGIYQRISTPLIRKDGKLLPATWDQAYQAITSGFEGLKNQKKGIAALVSTRLPAEALYQFKSLFQDQLHSDLVASIEEDTTTAVQHAFPGPELTLNGELEALKEADCVIAIGVDLARSHQVAGFLIKRNLSLGTGLIVIDPFTNEMSPYADYALNPKPGTDSDLIFGIMASIKSLQLDRREPSQQVEWSQFSPTRVSQTTGIAAETIVAVSREIALANKPVFIYGKGVTRDKSGKVLGALLDLAGMIGSATFISPKGKANSLAAHSYGLDYLFEPKGYQAAYIALGDDIPSDRLIERLEHVPFLAVQASYISPLVSRADMVLPVETWYEQEGYYLNLEGRLQQSVKAVRAPIGVLSNVAVLKTLAEHLGFVTDDAWEAGLFKRVAIAAEPVG